MISLWVNEIQQWNSKRRDLGQLRTNKKVTEFSASMMTLAAFQSGPLNRWLAANVWPMGRHLNEVLSFSERLILAGKHLVFDRNKCLAYFQPGCTTTCERWAVSAIVYLSVPISPSANLKNPVMSTVLIVWRHGSAANYSQKSSSADKNNVLQCFLI